jgi:hypothetical protein
MPESDVPVWEDHRSAEHQLWLAMQAAYNRYKLVSEALDALLVDQSSAHSPECRNQFERAAGEQRTAFEHYIDARMQFSEFLLSRSGAGRMSNAAALDTTTGQPLGADELVARKPWSGFAGFGLAWPAAVVALLCTAVFSLAHLVGEQRLSRDLGAVRQQLSAATADRDQFRALAQKLETGKTNKPPARITAAARPALTKTSRAAARKPAQDSRWTRYQIQLGFHEFTLAPSNEFARVGPVRLSLRKVDLKRQYLDLVMLADDVRLEKKHVHLFEPVWILGGRGEQLELVVERIGKSQVQGYLKEVPGKQPELAQITRGGSRTRPMQAR